ncbi:MAG TPA: LysM peptidoglycan-binding domain-containing protein [Gammaproteobacteria bacterium]|nr:LysM peptidoglycan-binding domain-containing protein [Gammaproteobacteria bacterium]
MKNHKKGTATILVILLVGLAQAACALQPRQSLAPAEAVPLNAVAASDKAATTAATTDAEDPPSGNSENGTGAVREDAREPIPHPAPDAGRAELVQSPPPAPGGEEAVIARMAASDVDADGPAPAEAQDDSAPADLWDRIRAGFAIPVEDHPRITAERNWYVNHPQYLERTMARARPYLHLIVEALEARDMPLEIALLPIVESAYQPFAYSHGRAAGIWQFIPGTARHYGLKQNWWYDGRRDIVASTRAALDYLQYLNRTFDGDWLLALAAYNSGSGTVKNAMRKNRRRGRPTDFWSLNLPRETRAYVPKLLAISEIVSAPESYGVSLAPIPDAPYLVAVPTGSQIDLALAAELAGLSLDDIYRYNPGFNRWATDPDGPHRLLLPMEVAATFASRLAEVPPSRRIKWVRHRIREGETLGHIARRYGTTVAVLRQVNGLRGHLIRAGKSMLIPVATRDLRAYRLSEEQRLRAIRSRPRGSRRIIHVVRPGDTFWDLSRKYGVGMRQLARWNGMATRDFLRPGQKLVIWHKGKATTGPRGTTRRIRYTVRKGDSLARISQRFRVTVSELRKWNGLPKGKYLQPGQKLTLYVDVTRQTGS